MVRNLFCSLCCLFLLVTSCKKEGQQHYVFIKKHCSQVTVGGVVGIAERCFEIGETVEGFKKSDGVVTIRIAAHAPINDQGPSNMSYQELLDVPSSVVSLK